MGIIERYLADIKSCLKVYEQLYTMQKTDKMSVYKYIGDFYKKQETEDGKRQIVENSECYSRVMTNIHLFRWLELERYQADSDTIQCMQRNGLWATQSKEMANKALQILQDLNIQSKQNGYQLDSQLLLGYLQMQDIQTKETEIGLDDQEYGELLYSEDGDIAADFDSIEPQDLGFEYLDNEDEETLEDPLDELVNDEDNLDDPLYGLVDEDLLDDNLDDEDLLIYDEDLELSADKGLTEQEVEDRKHEAEKIRAKNETESNRVEIPIDTKTNKSIEIQFSKIIEQQYVQALMPTFKELYSSGFQGITSPDGILTPRGVLKYEQLKGDSRKQWHFNHQANGICEDTQVYKNYMNMVLYAIGVLNGAKQCQQASNDNEQFIIKKKAIEIGKLTLGQAMGFQEDAGETSRFPKIQHLSKGENIYYPYMHHAFMTGYYALCSGLKKEQIQNKYCANTVKVTSYDDLSKWIHNQIKTCLIKAITDYGLGEDAETYEVDAVCKKMINAIKNVIIIQDKQKAYLTIKICQNKLKYSSEELENILNEYLTSTSGASVGIKAIVKQLNSDVATVDIVLDEDKYNQNDLMASSVIDSIIESGQIPSWNNAILGRDDKGIVNYDFTKQNRCAVQIYGASGQGKGLITQAILSNALIDNCNIFYFDGKPDNGAALGKIAWDRGQEAAVFNGLTGGQNTYPAQLEKYQHGLRHESQLYKIEDIIPDFEAQPITPLKVNWPFSQQTNAGRNLRKQLLDVSRTLMAFQFISDIVEIRANSKDKDSNIKQADDFCVFIIDEIQNAQAAERNIRQQMFDYMQNVEGTEVTKKVKKETRNGIQYEEKRDGKIKDVKNWNKDPGYIFCKKWINWANGLAKVQWNELVTKQLRNSRCTIITIFQTNEWFTMDDKGIGRYGSPTCSRIGYMMKELQPKVTKFVGKNGLKATGQNSWGDLPIEKFSWKDEVQSGKWVLAKDEGGLTNDSQILRPFKIFTTDLGNGVRCETDDRFAGGEGCRENKSDIYNENGEEKKDPVGLDSYTHYMFNNLREELLQKREIGLNPEEVLQKGYTYFDDCVKQFKGATQLLEYFYSLPQMVECLDIEDQKIDSSQSDNDLEDFDQDEFSISEYTSNDETSFDLQKHEQANEFLAGLNSLSLSEEEQQSDFDDLDNIILDFDGDDEDTVINTSENIDTRDNTGFTQETDEFEAADFDTNGFETGLNQVDTDGFETVLSDYDSITSVERPIYKKSSTDSVSEIQDVLLNQSLQADEKLAEMQKIVQRYNIKVNQIDCVPLEGQMLQDYTDINNKGFVQFNKQQYNRVINKPHPIGKDTIQARNSDLQGIKNDDRETNRQLSERYETVLNVICNNINKNTVVKLMITETTVQVNGRNLFLGRLLSNELTMADIVNIDKTFRRFGNLKQLIIDLPVLSEASNEYNVDVPINQMFIRCPQLQTITILGTNGKMANVQRSERQSLNKEIVSMIKGRADMDKIDAMCAQLTNDQRYKVKAVQVRKRISKVSTRMSKSKFGSNNSEFKNGAIQRKGKYEVQMDNTDNVGIKARNTLSGVSSILKGFRNRKL